uniref:Snake toxin/toxin-like domain-containing protein n=1 Tax=Onchocerca volvulus TaxID=6282 RepID=A0A8R1U2E4_ONCVO
LRHSISNTIKLPKFRSLRDFSAISGECLKCYSCDDPEDCANPREEYCPKNNECFTIAENYDTKLNGLRKGCSPTCDRVNIQGMLCRTCKFELCNGKTGKGISQKIDNLSKN